MILKQQSFRPDPNRKEHAERTLLLQPRHDSFEKQDIQAMSNDIQEIRIGLREGKRVAFATFASKELAEKNRQSFLERGDMERVESSYKFQSAKQARTLKVTMPDAQYASTDDVRKLSEDIQEVDKDDGTFFVRFETETDAIRNYKMLQQKPGIQVSFLGYKARSQSSMKLYIPNIYKMTEEELMAMSEDILTVHMGNRWAFLLFGSEEIALKNLDLLKKSYPRLHFEKAHHPDYMLKSKCLFLRRSEEEPESNEDIFKLSDKITNKQQIPDGSRFVFLQFATEFDAVSFYRQNYKRFGRRLHPREGGDNSKRTLTAWNIFPDVTEEQVFKASDYILRVELYSSRNMFCFVMMEFLTERHAKQALDKWKTMQLPVDYAKRQNKRKKAD